MAHERETSHENRPTPPLEAATGAAGATLRRLVPETTSATVDLHDGFARIIDVFAGDAEVDTADDTGPFDCETLGEADEILRQAVAESAPGDLEAAGWVHVPDEKTDRLYRIAFPLAGSAMVEVLVSCNDAQRYPALIDPAEERDGFVRPWFDLETVREIAADTQNDAARFSHGSVDTVHVLTGQVDVVTEHAVVLNICWIYLGGEKHEEAVEICQPNEEGRYAIGGFEWCWYQVDPVIPCQVKREQLPPFPEQRAV